MLDDSQKLWILTGLIGSGKTSFSKKIWEKNPTTTLRVCLDEIIQMTSFYKYDPRLNTLYGDFEKVSIVKGLVNGLDVIVDRTNLTREHRLYFLDIGKKVKGVADTLHKFLLIKSSSLWEPRDIKNLLLRELYFLWNEGRGVETLIFDAFNELVEGYSEGEFLTLFENKEKPSLENHLQRVSNLKFVSVYFDVPPEICLERRLKDPSNILREQVQKINWEEVLNSMKRKLETPRIEEGFDSILYVNKDGEISSVEPS